ncbi:MAG: transposase, partial [Eubacteriales bacterium]
MWAGNVKYKINQNEHMVAFSTSFWYTIRMKENLIHARTCVYNINYHVVWSVKYRRAILNEELEVYLKNLVQEIGKD